MFLFKEYSLTLASLIVGGIGYFVANQGVIISADDLHTTINTLVVIGTAIGVYIGRYRAGGITWYGSKK
jgi:hypothetical protein